MLQTICYVSGFQTTTTPKIIDNLLQDIKVSNLNLDISGVLIYQNGNFLKILEGEAQNVNYRYNKENNYQHVIPIINTTFSDRVFENYDTGFSIIKDRKKLIQFKSYLNWLKKAELENVNRLIKFIENFIQVKALQNV